MPTSDLVERTAREVFGCETLLPGQADAVAALLGEHDLLLVEPTGGVKSLAYQLPADHDRQGAVDHGVIISGTGFGGAR